MNRRPIRWDSSQWLWVFADTDEPLTCDEVEALGLDPGSRFDG